MGLRIAQVKSSFRVHNVLFGKLTFALVTRKHSYFVHSIHSTCLRAWYHRHPSELSPIKEILFAGT